MIDPRSSPGAVCTINCLAPRARGCPHQPGVVVLEAGGEVLVFHAVGEHPDGVRAQRVHRRLREADQLPHERVLRIPRAHNVERVRFRVATAL